MLELELVAGFRTDVLRLRGKYYGGSLRRARERLLGVFQGRLEDGEVELGVQAWSEELYDEQDEQKRDGHELRA